MVELGLGAQAVLTAGGRGTVAATFAKAAYLRLPAGLVALATADVPSGPIHVRGGFAVDRLVAGDRVTVDGSHVSAGPVSFDLAGATVWAGALPTRPELAAAADLALEILDGAPPSALADPTYAARLVDLDPTDLAAAVDTLSGLGPGLTPAGDDALAGILLLAQDPSAVDLVAEAPTNDIARAFLVWAARGQSIEPVHRFLTTVAGRDQEGARRALGSLVRFGHSSGADLALGLRLGFRALIANGT